VEPGVRDAWSVDPAESVVANGKLPKKLGVSVGKFGCKGFRNAAGQTATSGVASIKLRVYGCEGRVVIWSVSPISTSFPRLITAIRLER
jgi:hypothetical protein